MFLENIFADSLKELKENMKKIDNKITSIDTLNKEKARYSHILLMCLNYHGGNGINIDEMKRRFKIMEILEKHDMIIKLEDADFEKLKECFMKMPWNKIDKELIELDNIIMKL